MYLEKFIEYINKYQIEDESLLNLLMDFIEENEIPLSEMIDEIKADKEFKKIFYDDLVKNGEIYFKDKNSKKIKRPKKHNLNW